MLFNRQPYGVKVEVVVYPITRILLIEKLLAFISTCKKNPPRIRGHCPIHTIVVRLTHLTDEFMGHVSGKKTQ